MSTSWSNAATHGSAGSTTRGQREDPAVLREERLRHYLNDRDYSIAAVSTGGSSRGGSDRRDLVTICTNITITLSQGGATAPNGANGSGRR
ncbi:hypothetical protein GGR51DRAFT_565879 [Nemania sp. FL0031]|nr:hypothetical protein GGR51DRAFT_565879 [Nemania sp. FL0031]